VSESLSYSQPIINFQNNNGVLAWITQKFNDQYIHIRVYNPALQKFVATGGESSFLPSAQFYNLSVDSGVVAYQRMYSDGSYDISYTIYSPITLKWLGGGSISSGPVSSLQNKGGVVAFIDGTEVVFTILDWCYDNKDYPGNIIRYKRVDTSPDLPSSLNITDGTVSYVTGGQLNTWGYDAAVGQWVNGTTTKPIAYFLAQPSSGAKPPLWVWFTDASIGATNWSWQFGDGTSSAAQSPFHNYTQYGSFKVTLTITGPNGVDTCVKNIRIGGVSPPLDLLLLGD
jgi:PKD repeat protein